MKFRADIRKLQGIIALAFAMSFSGLALAQQVVPEQAQTTLPQQQVQQQVQQGQSLPAKTDTPTPNNQTPVSPSSAQPPLAEAPLVSPPIATPPVAKPITKPRKKGPVDRLKPGEFMWVAQDVYDGPMKIVIVLDIQRIYVFQNDKLIGFSTISSGKKGKETPTGYFNILQKNVDHKSNLYSNAPMPYMQRLTWDGIAIHGGHLPGYPASHGCIRLPLTFSKALFGVTQMQQEVVVLQDTSTPVARPEPKPVVDPVMPAPTDAGPVPPQIVPAPPEAAPTNVARPDPVT